MENETTTDKPTTAVAGRLQRLVMMWQFMKCSDAWFLLFLAFSTWSFFFAPDDALLSLVNLVIVFMLLVVWNLIRIAQAIEKKNTSP